MEYNSTTFHPSFPVQIYLSSTNPRPTAYIMSSVNNFMFGIHVAVRVNLEKRLRRRIRSYALVQRLQRTTTKNLTDFLILAHFEQRILRELVRRIPLIERRNGYRRVLATVPKPLQYDYRRRLYAALLRAGIVQLPLILQQANEGISEDINPDRTRELSVASSGRRDSPTIPSGAASERPSESNLLRPSRYQRIFSRETFFTDTSG